MSVEAIKEQLQLINQEAEKPFPDAVFIERRQAIARKAIRESFIELMSLAEKYGELEGDGPPIAAFIPTPDGEVNGVMLQVLSACSNGPCVQLNCEPAWIMSLIAGGQS